MTNREAYRGYLQQLQAIYSINEASIITDWVFEKVAGIKRSDIIKNPDQSLIPEITVQLNHHLIALLQHIPVQYVLGEAWFCKMKFMVNKNVLIPRPETEELVQLVTNDYQHRFSQQKKSGNFALTVENHLPWSSDRLSILDIGTGSGCIAIALKKSLPAIKIYAIDISPGALSVAEENATTHTADIHFSQVDFLNENNWKDLPQSDVIISNPPYIPVEQQNSLDKNVAAFEPHEALFVPDNAPLIFYEKIAAFGETHLNPGGKIFVEIHEENARATMDIFQQVYQAELINDMFGKERMIVASKKLQGNTNRKNVSIHYQKRLQM